MAAVSTRRNLVANLAGSAWTAVVQLAFIPVYLRFLGIEAYGLIGLFATLQALVFLLDLGLSTTVNRQIAKATSEDGDPAELRDLVRTLEAAYWLIAVVLGAGVLLAAPAIAHRWLQAEQLDAALVERTVRVMGAVLALLAPTAFYSGALYGLQRHVVLNAARASMVTVQALGAVLVLWWVAPSIEAFFVWQALAVGAQTALLATLTWKALPAAERRPHVRVASLRSSWEFAAGMTAITIASLVLTHMDKIVLSKLLTLEQFGYYSLAAAIVMGLYKITAPVFSAVFPRMTQLVASRDETALCSLYHRGAQIMSVLLFPVAVVIALFSREVVFVWVGSVDTAVRVGPIVALLVVGTALNGLMNVPYALQLAYGWTRLALVTNAIAIAVLLPALIYVAERYGGIGAAAIWIVLNAGYVIFVQPIVHRRLLRGELSAWYGRDVALPLLAALTVAGAARWLVPPPSGRVASGAMLVAVVLAALAGAGASASETRAWMLSRLGRR